MNYFFSLAFVIGFGALALLAKDPAYLDAKGRPDRRRQRGGDPPRQCRRGGSAMLGFISAVAFSTILAVVAGLTLAGASAVSHDLYASVFRKGPADGRREMRVSKIATVGLARSRCGSASRSRRRTSPMWRRSPLRSPVARPSRCCCFRSTGED